MKLVQRNDWSPRKLTRNAISGDRLECPRSKLMLAVAAQANASTPESWDRHLLFSSAVKQSAHMHQREMETMWTATARQHSLMAKFAVLVIYQEGLWDRFIEPTRFRETHRDF